MDEPTELEAGVMRGLIIGFFLWSVGVDIFLFTWKQKGRWGQSHYLSWHVILATFLIICIFEYFVFS